ncbi:MAG: methionyl-tRNA formyltransferase, partial [Firmicutes bacterium]|nr:methionyl-tRNA formyltransferase [Bacillota bacterium]
ADKIYNLVRGSVPRPGAGTFFQGQLIKIMEATGRPVQREGVPGEILGFEEDGFVVGTGSEGLLVRKGNVAGKKRGSALDLAREIGLMVGDRLGQ